jgi:DUF4097 and DUF4098 domain-containing protein YvlB
MKDIDEMVVLREEDFHINQPEVTIETVSSDVKVIESIDGSTRVAVCSRSSASSNRPDSIEISENNGHVRVSIDKGFRGLRMMNFSRVSKFIVIVHVPSDSTVKVRTVSADVEIQQSVSSLDITSVSGNLSVERNPRGKCSAKTVSGNIDVDALSACGFSLKSVSGNIKVRVVAGLEVDIDGSTISGELGSEIPLTGGQTDEPEESDLVSISASTVSGDFSVTKA